MLIKDSLPAKEIKFENIIEGNYSRLTFRVKDFSVLVKCIYAPNEDMTRGDVDNKSSTFLQDSFQR